MSITLFGAMKTGMRTFGKEIPKQVKKSFNLPEHPFSIVQRKSNQVSLHSSIKHITLLNNTSSKVEAKFFSTKRIVAESVPFSPSYSHAVLTDDGHLEVSGLLPLNHRNEIHGKEIGVQTTLVLEYIHEILKKAGFTFDDVTKTEVFLADIDRDFAGMNSVYQKYFTEAKKPARQTIQAKLFKGALVEISCKAYKKP